MATFRILCVDGGGIRGLIPAIWLASLEDDLRERSISIQSCFDLVCGTSTGSIVASAVCAGISMHQLISFFEDDGPNIFKKRLGSKLKVLTTSLTAKYNSRGLSNALKDGFGNRQLHDAINNLCITAYDIENRKTVLLRSYDRATKDVMMSDACLASSSAPTYFEPARIMVGKSRRILIDGGVVANNPSALAIAEAIAIKKKSSLTQSDLDISIVSLGTGSSTRNLAPKDKAPKGWYNWAGPILDVMFDGSSSMSDHISRQVLDPKKYFRLQFEMLPGAGSDDLDNAAKYNIDALKAAASAYLDNQGLATYKDIMASIIRNPVQVKAAAPTEMPDPE